MDDKSQIDKLYDDVSARLQGTQSRDKIVCIAHRLVASCFYFEKIGLPKVVDGHFEVQGNHCSLS